MLTMYCGCFSLSSSAVTVTTPVCAFMTNGNVGVSPCSFRSRVRLPSDTNTIKNSAVAGPGYADLTLATSCPRGVSSRTLMVVSNPHENTQAGVVGTPGCMTVPSGQMPPGHTGSSVVVAGVVGKVQLPPMSPHTSPIQIVPAGAVGASVGNSLGASLGVDVGRSVGVSVGVADGKSLGTSVGVSVGGLLGAAVGASVGALDGASVGT